MFEQGILARAWIGAYSPRGGWGCKPDTTRDLYWRCPGRAVSLFRTGRDAAAVACGAQAPDQRGRPEPDWPEVHRESKQGKHVTLPSRRYRRPRCGGPRPVMTTTAYRETKGAFEQPPGMARRDASTMPRRMISSASSRWLHGLIGRSASDGAWQARAMIWQTCPGPIRAGAPERGASASRSATPISSTGTARTARQRARHCRAVLAAIPHVRTTWGIVQPIRCGQDEARPHHQLLPGGVPTH